MMLIPLKPKLLAIETSTEACSAALYSTKGCLWRFEIAPKAHASLLLPMIESLLAQAQLSLDQLDAIAVTRGPGSFTGVRIGIGVAQGLSYGLNLPVYEVSTLDALALEAMSHVGIESATIVVALDARMNEVYAALYQYNKGRIEHLGQE